ncbi:hypothetical protein FQA39_LY13298 [Lamprigera yunnana]|nr:hypothetical protein FQA39_LY13298 [Lamprigera yunnana]
MVLILLLNANLKFFQFMRITTASVLYFTRYTITSKVNPEVYENLMGGASFGWALGSALVVAVALKGIVDKRYMLIYPYIVVLIFEVVILLISCITLAITSSPWHLLEMVIIGGVDIYTLICLISMYQHVKQLQKSQRTIETVTFKTV